MTEEEVVVAWEAQHGRFTAFRGPYGVYGIAGRRHDRGTENLGKALRFDVYRIEADAGTFVARIMLDVGSNGAFVGVNNARRVACAMADVGAAPPPVVR